MKAIQTKYHGPTNTTGSRISATAEGCPRIYVSRWEYAGENVEYCHRAAAHRLRDKMGWAGEMVGGTLPDGKSMAWVFKNDMQMEGGAE